jgi:hypothetical protein
MPAAAQAGALVNQGGHQAFYPQSTPTNAPAAAQVKSPAIHLPGHDVGYATWDVPMNNFTPLDLNLGNTDFSNMPGLDQAEFLSVLGDLGAHPTGMGVDPASLSLDYRFWPAPLPTSAAEEETPMGPTAQDSKYLMLLAHA